MTSAANKTARPVQAKGVARVRGSARPAVFEVTASNHPDYPVGKQLTQPRSAGSRRRTWRFATDDYAPRLLSVTIEFRRIATDAEWFAHNAERGYAPPTPAARRKR